MKKRAIKTFFIIICKNKTNSCRRFSLSPSFFLVPPRGALGGSGPGGYGSGSGGNGGLYGSGGGNGGTGPGGSSLEKARNTQMPAPNPSRQPPLWMRNSGSRSGHRWCWWTGVGALAWLGSGLTQQHRGMTAFVSSCWAMIYSLLMLLTFT